MDTYTTLQAPAEAQLTEKRSRFMAFAHPVADEEEAKAIIAGYKKKYHDARHVCYAYALGETGQTTRANDDGEPSGTAGRPILGQIASAGLTYTLVAVVRYFGGVKLGTGPLAVAYKTVTADVLTQAPRCERIITSTLRISAPYADADVAMRYVREAGATITARDYTATETLLTISVRRDDADFLRQRLSGILSLRFIDDRPSQTGN